MNQLLVILLSLCSFTYAINIARVRTKYENTDWTDAEHEEFSRALVVRDHPFHHQFTQRLQMMSGSLGRRLTDAEQWTVIAAVMNKLLKERKLTNDSEQLR